MNRSRPRSVISALACVSALLASACGSTTTDDASGGASFDNCPDSASALVKGDTIKVATTGPISGPYAAIGEANRAVEAYFNYYNAKGGIETVDGRKKVEVAMFDDQYVASKAQENIKQAVERDRVVAVAVQVGTANAEAVAPYLNSTCVPQLFPVSGATGLVAEDRPFTTQLINYEDQATVAARYIESQDPKATVAVLYQNDDLGQSLLDGFTEAVEGTDIKITAEESYEPSATTVKAQMTTLEASGADFLFNASAGAACTQMFTALKGGSWDPQIVQGNNCNEANISQAPAGTTDNISGAAYLQSPLVDTEGMELFREIMESAGVKPSSTALVGYSNAQAAAAAISAAGELSSIGIAKAAVDLGPEPPSPSIYLEGTTFAPGLGHPLLNSYRVAEYDARSGSFDGVNGELITVD